MVLRGNRQFTLLFVAQTLSAFIDWVYIVALFVLAYDLTGDPTVVALLTFARLAPYAVLIPVAGAITDRVDHRRLMVVALIGRALAILALTLVHDTATLPLAFVLVVLAATLSSLFRPALLASVPDVVPERGLLRANAVLGQVDMAAYGGGPAIVSVLLLAGSARLALVVSAAGLLVAAGAVWAADLHRRDRNAPAEALRPMAVLDGFRYLATGAERILLGIAVAWAGLTLWGGAYWALSVVLAQTVFRVGASGVGFINASYAVGGFLGGFVAAAAASRFKPAPMFISGAAASSVAEALFGLSPSAFFPFLFFFIVGAADAVAKITATTVIQAATPRRMLGRVYGAFESLFILAMAAGALVAGPLIHQLGARTACVVIALAGLGLLLVAIPLLIRIERVVGLRMFLAHVPVLNLLPTELVDELIACLRRERHAAGTTIIRQGEEGDRMYLIREGCVEVSAVREGKEVAVTTLRRGDYFGEIALLENTPRTATCRSVEDVELYVLLRPDFERVMGDSAAFGEAVQLEVAARRLQTEMLLLAHH